MMATQQTSLKLCQISLLAAFILLTVATPLPAIESVNKEDAERPTFVNSTFAKSISKSRLRDTQSCYIVSLGSEYALYSRKHFCIDSNSIPLSNDVIFCDSTEKGDTLQMLTIQIDTRTPNRLVFKYSINQYGIKDSASAIGDVNSTEILIFQPPEDSVLIRVRKSMPRTGIRY